MSLEGITTELFGAGELGGIEEGLHWGFAEAVTALVGSLLIVVGKPVVEIGLQFID